MRSLIQQLINNQRYLSIAIFGSLITFLSLWYFLFYQNINKEYSDSQRTKENINNELKRYRSMHSQLPSMESEWEELNNEFQIVIDRIPDKRLFTNVTDYLYSMIINNGLKIINYSPSNIAIEKKKIYIPDLEDEILVEKIPIDITLKGSFLSFSKLLEDMQDSRYRLTSSDIGIKQKESSLTQSINFIAYAYFQTSKNKKISPKPQKIQKNEPTELPKKAKSVTSKSNIDADNIVDNKIPLSQEIIDAKFPLIIIGQSALKLKSSKYIFESFKKFLIDKSKISNDWKSLNILSNNASTVGGYDLNIPTSFDENKVLNDLNKGLFELVFLFGQDNLDFNKKNEFVIYIGSHGDKGAQCADIILPSAAYTEQDGYFTNLEGKLQKAFKATYPPGDAKEDWEIINELSEKLSDKKLYQNKNELEKAMINFLNLNSKKTNDEILNVEFDNEKLIFDNIDYYYSNVIARASHTMTQCRNEKLKMKKTGTEG